MNISKKLLAGVMALAMGGASQAAIIGPQLSDQLAIAETDDLIEVIVTYKGDAPPNAAQLAELNALGVAGFSFQSLPMAGVLATPQQIAAMDAMDDIRSLYFNAPLEYENEEATQLTGVDRLREDSEIRPNGLPVSGLGVGVVVNDSGVDGLHPDISYPNHVIQNVLAQTNLRSFSDVAPITYVQNVQNTDIAGGHGSHVAGIIGATGAASDGGRMEGVAPGANLVGYGSGAALFILDTIGGFDYALTNRFTYNIRVISNSFGSPSDTGTDFDPENPTNIATKQLSDSGVIVVFSAGNSGNGEATITGNFKKAPWVVTVAAGDKSGRLADFSSRGEKDRGGEVVVDGETFVWEDRPTVTAPGVDIYSVRASTSDGLDLLGIDQTSEDLSPAELPYYTALSGTSMSAPHVSGIVALMLEADGSLTWREVKQILQDTATNMPGLESWEAGAGYVNAYAAVEAVLERASFGATVNQNREFTANANFSVAGQETVPVEFMPVGPNGEYRFQVGEDIALVSAASNVGDNTVAIVLTDPNGNRYGSSISLPVLGQNIAAAGAGVPGEWTLTVSGIGAISGIGVDPLGLTNGVAAPGSVDVTIKQLRVDGYTGIDDTQGHPAEPFIQLAVRERLVDSKFFGKFKPDQNLDRDTLAKWLVMGAAVRQAPSGDRNDPFDPSLLALSRDSVLVDGAALKDVAHDYFGVMQSRVGSFDGRDSVSREELAYSLIQALGLQDAALDHSGDVAADFNGQTVVLDDQGDISQVYRGYVQLAIALNILPANFRIEQDFFGQPVVRATFEPQGNVSRATYAAAATRFLAAYNQ